MLPWLFVIVFTAVEHLRPHGFDSGNSSDGIPHQHRIAESTTGSSLPGSNPPPTNDSTVEAIRWYKRRVFFGATVGTAIGAGSAIVTVPLVIRAMGFGAGGIVSGSCAAKMMSVAAATNGGAVPPGSFVATLQSIGTAGLGFAGRFGVGMAGGFMGYSFGAVAAHVVSRNKNQTSEESGERQGRTEKEGPGVASSKKASGERQGRTEKEGPGVASSKKASGEPQGRMEKEGPGVASSKKASGEPQGRTEKEGPGVESSEEISELKANLNATPKKELLSIVLRDLDGNIRRFTVTRSEPLQKMFDEYFDQTGLAKDSVMFEFNGLRLDGLVSPEELGIENNNVVKAQQV